MISGNLARVTSGTAKTYENLATNFSFRVEGDGAVEPKLVDGFSSTAPLVESINQRSLRAFVAAEHALTQEETAPASKESGKESLAKLAEEHLGKGWTAESYYDYNDRAPGPDRTTVKYSGQGSSQEIDIEHRGGEPKINLQTKTYQDGWEIRHDISAPLAGGVIDNSQFDESAYFSRG
jgi:hypothetical protein